VTHGSIITASDNYRPGLRIFYLVPSEMPHGVFALLIQMNVENAKHDGARGAAGDENDC
jgi:hypothetical protein